MINTRRYEYASIGDYLYSLNESNKLLLSYASTHHDYRIMAEAFLVQIQISALLSSMQAALNDRTN